MLAVVLLGAAPVTAQAQSSVAPPGISGADQYKETIPGATGAEAGPTNSGSDAGGGSSGDAPSGSGSGDAQRAAALAEATAPGSTATGGGAASSSSGSDGRTSGADRTQDGTASVAGTASPGSSVLKAVTGATSPDGGSGPLLPIVLVLGLIGAGALLVWRRRSAS